LKTVFCAEIINQSTRQRLRPQQAKLKSDFNMIEVIL
jgi:hypothetical protein